MPAVGCRISEALEHTLRRVDLSARLSQEQAQTRLPRSRTARQRQPAVVIGHH
ncbi:MAG: hypothetical protein R3F53_19240 [Gammaproteobacteria bacterium]